MAPLSMILASSRVQGNGCHGYAGHADPSFGRPIESVLHPCLETSSTHFLNGPE